LILINTTYYPQWLKQLFSIFELLWFLYSLLAIYLLSTRNHGFSVPLYYLLYYLFGFSLGSFWLAKNGNLDIIPVWYLIFAMLFGGYYIVISAAGMNRNPR